jgi:hypothetical protein
VIVLNGKTVYLADLFGGEYGLHEKIIPKPQINADTRRYEKSGPWPPRLPAAAPTVRFSRILNLYGQWSSVSREILKKYSGRRMGLFQKADGPLTS